MGLNKHGLLTSRTIQAHCTFLSPSDLSRIHEHGTAIAHCPLSNAYFSAEIFRLREALDEGVKVGLGTDIAGGYSADIMNTMRQAVVVSRVRQGRETIIQDQSLKTEEQGLERNLAIDWKEALYLATKGGATALGLNSGLFEAGAPFDAQMSESSLANIYDQSLMQRLMSHNTKSRYWRGSWYPRLFFR